MTYLTSFAPKVAKEEMSPELYRYLKTNCPNTTTRDGKIIEFRGSDNYTPLMLCLREDEPEFVAELLRISL